MRATHSADGETVHVEGEAEDGTWDGWTFTVRSGPAGAKSITMSAPAGRILTGAEWRAAPIGAVLVKARHLLREPALVVTLEALATQGIEPHKRAYGTSEHEVVARIYRTALEHGASAPEAVGAIYGVSAKRASNDYITPARAVGALQSAHRERELHPPVRGHWRLGNRVVNRPPMPEELRADLGVPELMQQELEREWNDYLAPLMPALWRDFLRKRNDREGTR